VPVVPHKTAATRISHVPRVECMTATSVQKKRH
jgi:hypothetical protein